MPHAAAADGRRAVKIGVQLYDVINDKAVVEYHEGDEVTEDTTDGELTIRVRDKGGNPVHWCRYAAGQWVKVWLEQGMSTEVAAARATRQVYTAATGLSPVPAIGSAGNSGPGF